MDTTYSTNQQKLLSLQDASVKLGVSVETLLLWNEYNILKPTITPTGNVGYTETQITQFLHIQQAFQGSQQAPHQMSSPLPSSYPSPTSLSPQSFDNLLQTQPSEHMQPSLLHGGKSPFLLFSTLAMLIALVSIGVLVQQGKLQSLLGNYERAYQATSPTPGSQTSGLELQGSVAIASHTQTKNDGALSKNDSDSVFAQKPTNAATISKSLTPTPTSNQQNRLPIATVAGVMKSLLGKQAATTDTTEPAMNDVLTYASVTSHTTGSSVPNSPFDKSGNLAGNTPKADTLAMNLSGVDIAGDSRSFDQLSTNLRNQLIVAIMGGLGLIVVLLRKKPRPEIAVAPVQNIVSSERLFELDQKMDGTVVLYYQGKAYKISKPELHSDSDQFIERLMTLYQPGSKEMEYDTAQDALKLTAPLSRLVTRLGFVGVKRDLFFPRTAKHSVLFRKYITRDDLAAMNVSVDQILRDMTIVA